MPTNHSSNGSRSRVRGFVAAGSGAAIAWGVWKAFELRWMSDDAYIVFRYAANLARGAGLVFNVEEKVEGYTDFLWVVWNALSFSLGIEPETWASVSGVVLYAGSLALLVANQVWLGRRLAPSRVLLPAAAILGAFHPDWRVWATGGLETSAYTFLVLLAALALMTGPLQARRLAASGLVFGLAAITRYDGVAPAFLAGLYVVFATRCDWRRCLVFLTSFLAVLGPFLAWRLWYYGDPLPNTFYTKSASLAWYGQGLTYLGLYVSKYWPLLLALPLLPLAARRVAAAPGEAASRWRAQVVLCSLMAVGFTAAIVRIGGDFMFARMLIPVTPFYLLLFELSLEGLPSRAGLAGWGAATTVAAELVALTPRPVPIFEQSSSSGVVDERGFYTRPGFADRMDERGRILKRYFEGLPVRILVFGTEVRTAYRSEAPFVLEGHGLTDPFVARQPLMARGRPGHEKLVTLDYAVSQRRVHFALHADWLRRIGAEEQLPSVAASLDGVRLHVLRWNTELMAELECRGAAAPNFLRALDELIAQLDDLDHELVLREFRKLRLFYFDHVADAERRAAFEERLARP